MLFDVASRYPFVVDGERIHQDSRLMLGHRRRSIAEANVPEEYVWITRELIGEDSDEDEDRLTRGEEERKREREEKGERWIRKKKGAEREKK